MAGRGATTTAEAQRKATHARYYQDPPQVTEDGMRRWITRAANFVVDVADAKAGSGLRPPGQASERAR
jgi:hypothetical protein